MHDLQQADLSEVHGTVRLRLLSVVQGPGEFARNRNSRLRGPGLLRGGTALAESRRDLGGRGCAGAFPPELVALVRLHRFGSQPGVLREVSRFRFLRTIAILREG